MSHYYSDDLFNIFIQVWPHLGSSLTVQVVDEFNKLVFLMLVKTATLVGLKPTTLESTVALTAQRTGTKWNSATIHFIIYTCAFLTVTCQNMLCETGILTSSVYETPWYLNHLSVAAAESLSENLLSVHTIFY